MVNRASPNDTREVRRRFIQFVVQSWDRLGEFLTEPHNIPSRIEGIQIVVKSQTDLPLSFGVTK